MKKWFAISSMLILLCYAGCGKEKIPEKMDLSLTAELAQEQEILDTFLPASSEEVIYDDPQTVGAPYIPEGAWCTEVSANEVVVCIDYRIDDIRYIVSYYSNGTIMKDARAMDGDKIYSVRSDKEGVEITDL
ncbi:MAG: hypothetical protein IJ405_07965 [Lachnospiraceae bacterium]|nr:hypothetical protein [Lachnospiraceae bacterium]MBQ7781939.1 hypothetical protein [Lachnospiraceae bacterium]